MLETRWHCLQRTSFKDFTKPVPIQCSFQNDFARGVRRINATRIKWAVVGASSKKIFWSTWLPQN
jgi:hypothetical protein